MPGFHFLHHRIDPNRCLVRVPFCATETGSEVLEWTVDALNILLAYASAEQQCAIKKHLDKHIGPESNYVLKSALIKYLIIITQALNNKIQYVHLDQTEKFTILTKLTEELENCSPGFMIRIKMIIGALNRPMTFDALLAQWRVYLATKASYGHSEIHAQYSFLEVANALGLAVSNDHFKDPHSGRLNVIEIEEKLSKTFLKEYAPAGLLQIFDNELHTLGYYGRDCDEGYTIEVFAKIHNWLKQIFNDEQLTLKDIFLISDAAMITDIDWLKLHTRLVRQLEQSFFTPLNEAIGLSWQHCSDDNTRHRLTLNYQAGDLSNGLLEYVVLANGQAKTYLSYLGVEHREKLTLLEVLPPELLQLLLGAIADNIQNYQELAILKAFSAKPNSVLFDLLFKKIIGMLAEPQDFTSICAYLNLSQSVRVYEIVKDKIIPMLNSLDDFCNLLKFVSPDEAQKLCQLIVLRRPADVNRLLQPLKPEQCALICRILQKRIERLIICSMNVQVILNNLASEQLDQVYPIFEKSILKNAAYLPHIVAYLNPQQIISFYKAIEAEWKPKIQFNHIQETLNAVRGERLKAVCQVLQEPMISIVLSSVSWFEHTIERLHPEVLAEFLHHYKDQIATLIHAPDTFNTIAQHLNVECATQLYLQVQGELDCKVLSATDYVLIAKHLHTREQSKFYEKHKNKIGDFTQTAKDFGLILSCLNAEHRVMVHDQSNINEMIKNAEDFESVLASLPVHLRNTVVQMRWDQLIGYIKNVTSFCQVMHFLNAEQKQIIKETHLPIMHTYSDLKEKNQWLKPYLSIEESSRVLSKIDFTKGLNSTVFYQLLSLCTPELQKTILMTVREMLPELLENYVHLFPLLKIVSTEEYAFIFAALQTRLNSIFYSRKGEFIHFGYYDRCPMLNVDQLYAALKILTQSIPEFEFGFDELKKMLRYVERLDVQARYVQVFVKMHPNIPINTWLSMLTALPPQTAALVKEQIKDVLFASIQDLDSFNLVYAYLNIEYQNKAYEWLKNLADAVYIAADFELIMTVFRNLDAVKIAELYSKISPLILTKQRHLVDYHALFIVLPLEERNKLYLLNSETFYDRIRDVMDLQFVAPGLSLKQCTLFFAKIDAKLNVMLKSHYELATLITALSQDKANLNHVVQKYLVKIDTLIQTPEQLIYILAKFNNTPLLDVCDALSFLIQKHIQSAECLNKLLLALHCSSITPLISKLQTHCYELIRSRADVVSLFRKQARNTATICIEFQGCLERLVTTVDDLTYIYQNLSDESQYLTIFNYVKNQVVIPSISALQSLLIPIKKEHQTLIKAILLDYPELIQAEVDRMVLLANTSTDQAIDAIKIFVRDFTTKENRNSVIAKLLSLVEINQRKKIFSYLFHSDTTPSVSELGLFKTQNDQDAEAMLERYIARAAETPLSESTMAYYERFYS